MVLSYILVSTFIVSLISIVGIFTLSMKDKLLKRIILVLVALSAGALMGGAFLHLIPEAIETCSMENLNNLFLEVLLGFSLFFVIEKIVHWRHCHDVDCKIHNVKSFGYMNLIGDSIHNFIDGLVIAAAFMDDINLGISTSIAIASHEIPQEIGDFGVLLHSGMEKRKAILMNFLAASTVILGGIVGIVISSRISVFVPMVLPIAAGGFIYIASSDLIPELKNVSDLRKSFETFIVFTLGIALMWAVKMFFS